jgi:site-specific recombinase XerD
MRAGADISVVQALLGHASILTTSRYTMASQADLEAAVDRLSVDW